MGNRLSVFSSVKKPSDAEANSLSVQLSNAEANNPQDAEANSPQDAEAYNAIECVLTQPNSTDPHLRNL
jgi:hypothetical protein